MRVNLLLNSDVTVLNPHVTLESPLPAGATDHPQATFLYLNIL